MPPTIPATLATTLAAVPAERWAGWVGDPLRPLGRPLVVAVCPLPVPEAEAALVLLEVERAGAPTGWRQLCVAACDPARAAADLLLAGDAGTAALVPGLALVEVRRWLLAALTSGVALRAGGWEWQAGPEPRPGGSLPIEAGALVDDVAASVVRAPHATLVFPRTADPDDRVELELLRRLAAGDGAPLVPRPLASARWSGPEGVRLPSLLVHDLPADAVPMATRLAARALDALRGAPGAFEGAVNDARSLGMLARELHAALGRPATEGSPPAAAPAGRRTVEGWTLEATDALEALLREAQGSAHDAQPEIVALRDHLPAIAAAAARDPGLVHRIHGAFDADAVHVLADGTLRVTGFRAPPAFGGPSPWHDVASLLASLTRIAGEAAIAAGDDAATREGAWAWEREARRAALDGYGPGGGAGHALAALLEVPLVARRMLRTFRRDPARAWIDVHAVRRLARVAT